MMNPREGLLAVAEFVLVAAELAAELAASDSDSDSVCIQRELV